jgi:hypothetical protein
MTRTFRTAWLILAVLLTANGAVAQEKSDAQIREWFTDASQNVFAATASIFACLSESRQGKSTASSNLVQAKKSLEDARTKYNLIATDRRSTKILSPKDPELLAILSSFDANRKNLKKRGVTYQGDVAQANIEAINDLLTQIGKWTSCALGVNDFLRFIENKINLERASQISEIVFSR